MNSIINILLFIVFIMILAVSFVGINMYLKKISLDDVKAYFTDSTPAITDTAVAPQNKNGWIDKFLPKDIPSFSYPSSELLINLDFSNEKKTDVLMITNLDSYKFFCLNEILKSNNIQFTYKKVSNFVTLQVALKDDKMRQKLVSELKKYNISYSIN